MIKMVLMESEKETDNKLRWDTMVGDSKFELYIPKWRVPKPWPSKIHVNIVPIMAEQSNSDHITLEEAREDPALVSRDIIADVVMKQEHTKTIRYYPEGNSKDWEIGEPYIPFSLTHGKVDRLRIRVTWLL